MLGSCEQCNDPLDSIVCWQFLDKVCETVCSELGSLHFYSGNRDWKQHKFKVLRHLIGITI